MRVFLFALVVAAVGLTVTFAQRSVQVFTGATVIPVSGPAIPNGVLVVENGRIAAVGPAGSVRVPRGADVTDLSGLVVMPGMICTHSHVAQPWGGDSSGPLQPEVRALDAVNVRAASVQKAQAGGITTANLMPGSGHLMGGQTLYVKFRDGKTVDDLALRGADGRVLGGLKMANGTNPQKAKPYPGTRAKSAALVRQRFIEAQEYRDKLANAAGDPEKKPARDLGLEALVEVLDGRRVIHHHTHRHDDILTVLRLSEEFGFRVVLHHVSEAWKVVDEIKAAGAACSLIAIDSPGGKLEARDIKWENAPLLEKAGVDIAFHTDDPINDSRLFLRSAAQGMRVGLSRQAALESLTLAGARMLDLDDRVGSLEVGKDADFVVLDGDPLSIYTKVLQTWIDGELVFDRSLPEDKKWAEGGWGAGSDNHAHHCCLGPTGRLR
ncbi:MAG: amidohydrolase family protein [Acidobacteriota bacterium]